MSLLDFLKQDAPAESAEVVSEPVAEVSPTELPQDKAAAAREALSKNIGWIREHVHDPVERGMAVLNQFEQHVPHLDENDPEDRDVIAAANQLFRAVNINPESEHE